ncbi:MAG: acetate/propionate family kinase [Planctomycetes bacterium]|nr:acetate/propionate family kinase [Planctomycetota bacterium]
MSILILNAGSSTLKLALYDRDCRLALSGLAEWEADRAAGALRLSDALGRARSVALESAGPGEIAAEAIRAMLRETGAESAASSVRISVHRVVHGGEMFRNSVRIDDRVKTEIRRLCELAPLHNPPALLGIEAAERVLPGVPGLAVFDTAFFAALPPRAFLYPLPYSWYTEWGIRRFGFHGISHAYCTERAAALLTRPAEDLRLVTCHLGNGCSASAVRSGSPVATTMGFTPLEGLMMGTRCGSVDPGILLHLLERGLLDPVRLDLALNHHSGLLGVSGLSSDFREIESQALAGHERARLALEMFADRVRATVGAFAATLGGLDALIFTAGIGEHSASLRARVCEGLECLGLRLDRDRNRACQPDADVAADSSSGRILVLHAREDLHMAREAVRYLTRPDAPQRPAGDAPRSDGRY